MDKLKQAQQQYDDRLPSEICEDDGHKWRVLGNTEDGCVFVKCKRCGKEMEQ